MFLNSRASSYEEPKRLRRVFSSRCAVRRTTCSAGTSTSSLFSGSTALGGFRGKDLCQALTVCHCAAATRPLIPTWDRVVHALGHAAHRPPGRRKNRLAEVLS